MGTMVNPMTWDHIRQQLVSSNTQKIGIDRISSTKKEHQIPTMDGFFRG